MHLDDDVRALLNQPNLPKEIKTFPEQHPLPRKDEFLKHIRDLESLDAGL